LANRVRSAVFWRSGSQIATQLLMWAATILVVRLLSPHDYGLFAMSQVLLVALNFLTGQSFASSLIQEKEVTPQRVAQVFGLLILFNAGLAIAQILAAPFTAAYFRQPIVEPMLYWQALIYIVTPFIALPSVLLARRLDFRSQAKADLAGALAGAGTALYGAYHGYGVWTLVFAPIIQQTVRAVGLSRAARLTMMPSFNFTGAGGVLRFGSALVLCQFLWVIQSQSDVVIAGRWLSTPNMTHQIGLYSEALFMALIFTAKFIPPLNEVAFPAYTQLAKAGGHVGSAFVRTARLLMFCAVPLYFGLSATAEPTIALLLGEKWLELAPILSGLAITMPFFALQIICSPTTNALGRPNIYVRTNLAGAIIMPIAFFFGIKWGIAGLVHAWQIAAPLLLLVTLAITLPVIGVGWRQLGREVLPSLFSGFAMYSIVRVIGMQIASLPALMQLAILAAAGAVIYVSLIYVFARSLIEELRTFVMRREISGVQAV
jgi:O-antigen/teichoic acid export membrane protein